MQLDFAVDCAVAPGMNPHRADRAEELFLQGYNCAQAVVHAFQPELGVDSATALKASTGFGAGMGRAQETCGAVAGGILVLGLRGGRALGEPKAKAEETYAAVRTLQERFAAKHGTCRCRDLLGGCDLRTEAGLREFKEKDYLHTRCAVFVREAVALVQATVAWP